MHNMGTWGQSLLVKWSPSSVIGHFHASWWETLPCHTCCYVILHQLTDIPSCSVCPSISCPYPNPISNSYTALHVLSHVSSHTPSHIPSQVTLSKTHSFHPISLDMSNPTFHPISHSMSRLIPPPPAILYFYYIHHDMAALIPTS